MPYRDGQGRVIGVVGIYEDITERKLAEEALKRSELTYREIFESVNDAIFVHDADSGRILDVNRKMCEIYSYTYEEALMVEVGDLSDPDCYLFSQVQAQEYMRRAKSGPQLFEWRARDKSGKVFWVEVNLKPCVINGEDRILAVVRNITERKRLEEETTGDGA